jgi:hypothetical protein
MVGSIFVAFTFNSTVEKVSLRVTTVDVILGNPNDIFNNEIELAGNITALQLVRSVGLDVQFENETFNCVQNYCNGEQNWEFYLNGGVPTQPADELVVEKDDQLFLIFR